MNTLHFSPARMRPALLIPAAFLALLAGGSARALGEVNAPDGVGISGHDPVSYFVDNKPVKGSKAHELTHGKVVYRFATAENRAAFAANPEKYLPQYGGYCAYGLSRGYKAPIDPAAFTVRSGKLYLNYDLSVQQTWRADINGYIGKADRNWPTVRKQ